jgi:DNA-binding NarL/FixJ family response regulator
VHPLSDEQLISLMAKDNEAAFTALYHRYWEMMLGMAFNRLKDLPEICRVVFRYSRQNGMSSREIAEHLGISHKTVDNQLNKALYCIGTLFFSYITTGRNVPHCSRSRK